MNTIIDINEGRSFLQGSLDWHRARLGHWTGSAIGKLMVSGRKKDEVFGDTAKSYIFKILAERSLSEKVVEDDEMFALYVEQTGIFNKAVQWGHDNEEEARRLYAELNKVEVTEVSSVEHLDIALYAASPDGCVKSTDKVIEIKCPNPDTAIRYRYLIKDAESLKKVNSDYYWQVMAEMDCTGATACDFIVYCPFLAEPMYVVTIPRNDEAIATIHERNAEAEDYIHILKKGVENERD
jgi:putative phage-type endonuclease